MIGIVILLIVLAILVLLLLLPVKARFSYNQGALAAWVCYGPVKLHLYPFAEKKEPKPSQAVPQSEKDEQKKKKPKTKREPKARKKKRTAKINKDQIYYSLDTLPPILGRALRRVGKRIQIDPLKVHLLVASADPADTAQLYGKLEAALSAGIPVLQRLVRVRELDVRLFPDFTENRMDCIADVGISIRPLDVLSITLRVGASLVKWLFRFRKLASPPQQDVGKKGEKGTTSSTEAA